MTPLGKSVRNLFKYVKNKNTQFRFFLAYRINALSIRFLHLSHALVSRHLYPLERESYTAELVVLHKKIQRELRAQRREYNRHRYAYGHPYQGLATLGVFGARSTEVRWNKYGLQKFLKPHYTILDIGCNCGFMSLYSVFRVGCKADAVDINPYMLNIGRHCAELLRLQEDIRFICSDFTKFKAERTYDVVFSFAAHHTEDGQHCPNVRDYLARIHSLLAPDGLLVFESHGYDIENTEFRRQMQDAETLFQVVQQKSLFCGQRELFYFRAL